MNKVDSEWTSQEIKQMLKALQLWRCTDKTYMKGWNDALDRIGELTKKKETK